MCELQPAIPLLAVLMEPIQGQSKKNRSRSVWKKLAGILSGAQSLHPQDVVDKALMKKLPRDVVAALGPFRMLCVANYCLGKSHAELVQQGNTEYAAVLKLKQLYEAGYFENSSKRNTYFFRRVCMTGLLQCRALTFHKGEMRLQLEAERASRAIVQYANSLSEDKSYPTYESRYPVVVEVSDDVARDAQPLRFTPKTRSGRNIIAGITSLPTLYDRSTHAPSSPSRVDPVGAGSLLLP